jgi:hypothetical protein
MRAVTSKETTIDFRYPKTPERRPEKKIDIPYPTERKIKILLAFAWLIRNSSSMSGRTGERIVRPTKLRNQRELRKRRYNKALPFSEVNLSTFQM